ncbi:MAG: thioredoxin family protein [Ignavibacteriae bacterium]|nr:thioredoxin family protein [Ignavibacteriota bacterium]
MQKHMRSAITILALLFVSIPVMGQNPAKSETPKSKVVGSQPLITFVELGSVRCIPCKQMQPVMKSIEEKYGKQVKVVFHDVWTDEGSPQAEAYKIKLIPTQVFLDAKGKEIFRHEGFYPEAEIDKLLQKHGLKIQQAASK